MKQSDITAHQRNAMKTYAQLMRASGHVTENMHRHLTEDRLTVSQFAVLEAIYHLGSLCQKEIGEKILKTSGNITMVIDNLEKRKMVRRAKDPNDRRRMIVGLTPKGNRLFDRVFPRHAIIAESVFSALSERELAQLGRLLKKLGKMNASKNF